MHVRQRRIPRCQHSDPCFRPNSLAKAPALGRPLRQRKCHRFADFELPSGTGTGAHNEFVECPPFSVSISFYVLSPNRVSGCRAEERADLWHCGQAKRFPSVRSAGQVPCHGGFAVWNGGGHRLAWATPERFDAQAGSLDGHPFVASQQHVPRQPSTRRF